MSIAYLPIHFLRRGWESPEGKHLQEHKDRWYRNIPQCPSYWKANIAVSKPTAAWPNLPAYHLLSLSATQRKGLSKIVKHWPALFNMNIRFSPKVMLEPRRDMRIRSTRFWESGVCPSLISRADLASGRGVSGFNEATMNCSFRATWTCLSACRCE